MVRQLTEIGPLKTYQALSPPLLTVPSTNDDSNDKGGGGCGTIYRWNHEPPSI